MAKKRIGHNELMLNAGVLRFRKRQQRDKLTALVLKDGVADTKGIALGEAVDTGADVRILLGDSVTDVILAVVEDVVGAVASDEVKGVWRGGRNNGVPGKLSELDGKEAGSRGAAVDEDGGGRLLLLLLADLILVGPGEAETRIQGMHGRRGRDTEGGGYGVVDAGGDLPGQVAVDLEVLGEGAAVGEEAAVDGAGDAVAHRPGLGGVAADLGDLAGVVAADHAPRRGDGVHVLVVRRVEGDGAHLDQDLVGRDARPRVVVLERGARAADGLAEG